MISNNVYVVVHYILYTQHIVMIQSNTSSYSLDVLFVFTYIVVVSYGEVGGGGIHK